MNTPPKLNGVFAWDINPDTYIGPTLHRWQYFRTTKQASHYIGCFSDALGKAMSRSKSIKGSDGVAYLGGVIWMTAQWAYRNWWHAAKHHLQRIFPHLHLAEPDASTRTAIAPRQSAAETVIPV